MKIWLINHYAVPPTSPGGTRHYSLARELIHKGHDVLIFASSFDHGSRTDTTLQPGQQWKLETVGGVPFCWLRTSSYTGSTSMGRIKNMLSFGYRILSTVKSCRFDKPDIVVGSSQHLFAALAAEWLARRYGVPFVFEVRDLMPQTLIELGHISPRHPTIRALEKIERYLYRKAKRIISLLPGAAEHIVAKGGASNKIVWIPNGVDLSLVPAPQPPCNDGKFTVMYAGAHGLANGLDSLLDAAAILNRERGSGQICFRFLGDGTEKRRLIERAQNEDLSNVSFENSVPKDQVYDLLRQADAFVVTLKNSPLYRWGMSLNKVFDYLALARPIVFGADIACNPVVEVRAGLTVPPENAVAMAEAIKRLSVMAADERWQMGLRGRRYVEENHDFSKLAERLEETLREVVAEAEHASA